MAYFPMMIDLEGKPVLVIGAGTEGTKKIEILSSFGCRITLIAKEAEDAAVKMAAVYKQKAFEEDDITCDYTMIVAATDDRELNKKISETAGRFKIPVNIVDDTKLCSFIFPAIIKDRDVVVSVSSGGKSPYVAQHIKGIVNDHLPDNIGIINDKMGEYRKAAKQEIKDVSERRRYLKTRLDEMLNG